MERPPLHHAMTLADYRRLEAKGQIKRPLTDRPMGKKTPYESAAPETPSRGRDTQTGSLAPHARPARRKS